MGLYCFITYFIWQPERYFLKIKYSSWQIKLFQTREVASLIIKFLWPPSYHLPTLTNQTIINTMLLHRFIIRLWLTSISSIRSALYHHNIALSCYVLVHMLVKFWHNWLKIFPSKSSCKIPPEQIKIHIFIISLKNFVNRYYLF